MVTVVPLVTAKVLTVNVALVAPGAMVTELGTVAAVGVSLRRLIVAPPAGAGLLSCTVPIEELAPTTVVGLKVSELSPTGRTVNVAVGAFPP